MHSLPGHMNFCRTFTD